MTNNTLSPSANGTTAPVEPAAAGQPRSGRGSWSGNTSPVYIPGPSWAERSTLWFEIKARFQHWFIGNHVWIDIEHWNGGEFFGVDGQQCWLCPARR